MQALQIVFFGSLAMAREANRGRESAYANVLGMQVIGAGYSVRLTAGEETKNHDKGHSVKQENLASAQVKHAYLNAVR